MITVFVDKIKLWYNLKVANNFFNFFGMEEENERKVNSPDNNTSDSFESLEVSEEIKAAKEEIKRLEAEIEVATAEFLAQKDKIETIQKDIENGNHEGKNLEKKQKIIQKIEEAMLLTKERIDRLKIKLEFKKELAESIGIERIGNTIGKKAYCEKKEIEDNITSIIGEGYKSEVTINSEILKKAGFSYVEFGASEGIRTSAVASIRKSKDGAFLIKTGTSWYRVKFDNMDGIEVVESGNDLLSEKDKELKKSIEYSLRVVEVNYDQGEEKIKSLSPESEKTKNYEIRLKSFLKRKDEISEKISPTDKNRKPDISQAVLDEADALGRDFIDFLNELFKPNKKEKSKDGSNGDSAGDSKEGDNSREMINAHIGELLADSKKEINNFDKKLQDFKKAFPESKKIISGLEDKRNEFISLLNEISSIDNDSRTQKDIVKLNQAYDKFYLLTRKNWEEEYKKRRSNREDNQKEEKEVALNNSPLRDLNIKDYHGSESPVIKEINRRPRERFINFLEEKFGKPGTIYLKKSKNGFPIGTIEILSYEIGKDIKDNKKEDGININNFVVVDSGKREKGEPVNEKIKIGELENYLRGYEREEVADFNDQEFLSPEDEAHIRELVEERMSEIEVIIKELKDRGDEALKGRLSKYENVFNNAKSIIEKDKHIFKNQSIANIINGIYEKVSGLNTGFEKGEAVAVDDVEKETVSEVEVGLELTKQEKAIIEDIAKDFIEEKFWEGMLKHKSGRFLRDDEINAMAIGLTKIQIGRILEDERVSEDRLIFLIDAIFDKIKSDFEKQK